VTSTTNHPRYLSENLTPEWKRAYIDYRACKKAIKVIARRLGQVPADQVSGSQEDQAENGDADGNDSSADEDYGPSAPPRKSPIGSVGRASKSGASNKSPNAGGSATPNSAGKSKASLIA